MAKLLGKTVRYSSSDVALNTAVEFVVLESVPLAVRSPTCVVHLRAWGQFTVGANTTAAVARFYRGNEGASQLIGEAVSAPLAAAAGGIETMALEMTEERVNAGALEYYVSLQQVGATAAGSFLQGAFEVAMLSG